MMRIAVLCSLLAACSGSSPAADAGTDAYIPGPDYLERLESSADYESLQGEGREVKFLTHVDGREPVLPPECLFQNTRRFQFHVQFLRGVFPELSTLDFDTYVSLVLRNATRRMWGGGLKRYDRVTHPITGAYGIYTYTLYSDPGPDEDLTIAQFVEVDRRLKGCMPYAASELVLVPETLEQQAHVRALLAELNAMGVAVRFPEELVERDYEAYSVGESYGYLHVVPQNTSLGDEYGPRDVLVLEAAPNDVSLVAGMITTLPQNVHSHANLRLRENALPNAMLATAYMDSRITALRDQLVHVVATDTAITIEAANLTDAQAFWDAHRPTPVVVHSDLSVTELLGFDVMRASDALGYGPKAANLGELHSILPAENRHEGFGIPFSAYRDYMAANNLNSRVATLLADPRLFTDRAYCTAQLASLRDAIRHGTVQAGLLDAIFARVREVFGPTADTMYIRFRSSTNEEDLEQFSGAGLHDSYSGCIADDLDGDSVGPSRCLSAEHRAHMEAQLAAAQTELSAHPDHYWLPAVIADLQGDLSDEKPVEDALRKVWRGIWNLRAFDAREYYGIDHTQVYMAMAVIETVVMEQMEFVPITNLRPDAGDPLYRVVSQIGEVGVVRPSDPTAIAETLTFRRSATGATEVTVLVPSSLSSGGAHLWSDPQLATLETLLFTVQDHFATAVYPDLTDLRLELDGDVTHDGRIVFKQARPYLGVEP